jgi:hypothetical protein
MVRAGHLALSAAISKQFFGLNAFVPFHRRKE